MKKIFILFLISILLLPTTIYGAHYTADDITGRETVEGDGVNGEAGVDYIAPGQPVTVDVTSTGIYSQEPFVGNDGNYYPAGTNMIVTDADGVSGTTREYESITTADATIEGRGNNDITIKVLAEIVTDFGADGADSVTFQVQEYVGEMYGSIEEAFEDLGGLEAWDSIDEFAQYIGYDDAQDWNEFQTAFFNEAYGEIMTRVGEYDPATGTIVIRNVDGSILAITGAEGLTWTEWVKLFSVIGEGDVDLRELLEEILPPGGGYVPPTGPWFDEEEATVFASVNSEKYNISDGIPTSEYVNGSLSASDMSWAYNVDVAVDSHSETINVKIYWGKYEVRVNDYEPIFNSKGEWIGDKYIGHHYETRYRHSDSVNVTGTYITHYFTVKSAQMNKLSGGSLSNGAVDGALASLGASNVSGYINRDGGIEFDSSKMNFGSFTVHHDTSRDGAISSAEGIIRNRIKKASYVKNDTLNIKSTVLSGKTDYGEEFGDTPYIFPSKLVSPSSRIIPSGGSKLIPTSRQNKTYPSSASATYAKVAGFDAKATYSIPAGASPVSVHTPVVNNARLIKEPILEEQKITKTAGVEYLMLDRTFTVEIPGSGTHRNIKNYGYKDNYNSYQGSAGKPKSTWGKLEDVKFTFDVYLHVGENRIFIKKNTWISEVSGVDATSGKYTFTIPVWAEEGPGIIYTRVVAENAPSLSSGTETGANLNQSNYIATRNLNVEVIGEIYDLRISATNDPGWTNIDGAHGNYITSNEFPFGQINQNKTKAYKYAPKLGYTIAFDFKTKGIKSNNVDVSVEPKGFYFVSKNGGEAQPVDLYYHTTNQKYIKIATEDTKIPIVTNLSNPFMKVAKQELIDSLRIMKQKLGATYTYSENVHIGSFPNLNLPESLRLTYNNFDEYRNNGLYKNTEVNISKDAINGHSYSTEKWNKLSGEANGRDVVIGSVGHWYAGYKLPASTIAVPVGTTPTEIINNPSKIKTNGYILIKFDIVTKDKDGTSYLQYTGPESLNEAGTLDKTTEGNQKDWTKVGTQLTTLPNGKPATVPIGTIGIIETDLRAYNDYETEGTH